MTVTMKKMEDGSIELIVTVAMIYLISRSLDTIKVNEVLVGVGARGYI